MRVRDVEASDAPAVLALAATDPQLRWSTAELTRLCAGPVVPTGELMLVLESPAGTLSGFIALAVVLDEAEIRHLLIDPACRREGLGAQLLADGLTLLQRRGVRRCLLEVRVSNAPARRLYERAGFRRDGVRPDYYPAASGREAAILMSMELSA